MSEVEELALEQSDLPPKDRDFLGLVDVEKPYWSIFFWAGEEMGVLEPQYVDAELFAMPRIVRWQDLPKIE